MLFFSSYGLFCPLWGDLGLRLQKCKALFGDELGASIVNVKRDVGDVFYVEFSDESTCLSGFKYIRTKEVDGKRVGVRVKSESFLKSMSMSVVCLELFSWALLPVSTAHG